jgi:putative ubiquitin-RnfH superfamily antitoxin RatB of RatAB toxin-antitoxin module
MPSWCGHKRCTARSVISPVIGPSICIEIVYAQPQHSILKSLQLEHGATIAEALAAAAEDPDFLGVDLANSPVGIFGKAARRDLKLNDGDRIEIYRPLTEEPKLARRKRASRDTHGSVRPNVDIKASKPVRS